MPSSDYYTQSNILIQPKSQAGDKLFLKTGGGPGDIQAGLPDLRRRRQRAHQPPRVWQPHQGDHGQAALRRGNS